ncbi:hypothetical protein R75461_07695 [Paraburkholderia nemoris]|uniref:hypothetical protein n=1 Tax=Paraburkholderia nemoris TaxID=2793076 RepID=UPI00190B9F8F|nr:MULTISPECIES: hypothetical protein [Paraburkholderia]MBK3786456.1 hypothetical protein [Paraburkholderia aspalathi]CAE6855647.1 hypothetical protein R75461_07695 [Paraburkholderia nemoris]
MSQRSTLRNVASVAAVFVLVWGIALIYWKSIYRVPSGQDLLLVGIALPVLLIASFIGVRKSIALTRTPVPGAPAIKATAPPPSIAGDDSSTWTLAVLDSSLSLPAGTTSDEIAALARQQQVVGLHAELRRADQTRIFASNVASVSLDDFDENLLPDGTAANLGDQHRRALMLAGEALDDLMQRHAVVTLAAHEDAHPDVAPFELHLLLPERWKREAPTLATWLDAHLAREPWSPATTRARVTTVANPVQALAVVDDLNVSLNRDSSPARHIVLACDSWLGENEMTLLERTDRLYGRNRPDGHVPGEGACALMLALRGENAALPVARVHRMRAAERLSSADEPEQARDDTTMHLLDSARTQTAAPGLEMRACALVSDASQRTSRRTEITGVAESVWPGSNAESRCQHLGFANGESGAVLALSAVAIAAAHSLNELQPTFAVSLADPLARAAVLVSPPWTAPVHAQTEARTGAAA